MSEELVRATIHREPGMTEYGRSLARLGLRAQRLETSLRLVEWGGPEYGGRGPCPACSKYFGQGHDPACFLDAALQPHDAISKAEEAVHLAQEILRHHSIHAYLDGIYANIQDISRVLDHAARSLAQF